MCLYTCKTINKVAHLKKKVGFLICLCLDPPETLISDITDPSIFPENFVIHLPFLVEYDSIYVYFSSCSHLLLDI